jgi:biopolymer transport protein ExbD
MRRFSQRSHLVTLSEINITPLLDLAFVLLIIFVITTPHLEQGLPLKPPQGGKPDTQLRKEDLLTVEVHPQGGYQIGRTRFSLPQAQAELRRRRQANPNLTVYVRADRAAVWDPIFQLVDFCARSDIEVSLRAEPRPGNP